MQLDATLRSFARQCNDCSRVPIRVLFKATTSVSRSLYRQLMREHQGVHFVEENNFREEVLLLLRMHEFILFVVDDCIFVRNFSLKSITSTLQADWNAVGCSLRLGRNTSYCYSVDKAQHTPDFQDAGAFKLSLPVRRFAATRSRCAIPQPQ